MTAWIAAAALAATCPPKAELRGVTAGQWRMAVACLDSPDSEVRDDFAFGSLQQWMRLGAIEARPVLFAGKRLSAEEWAAFFGRISSRAQLKPPFTQAALVRAHNAKQFLRALYVALGESKDAALRDRMLPAVSAALRGLE